MDIKAKRGWIVGYLQILIKHAVEIKNLEIKGSKSS